MFNLEKNKEHKDYVDAKGFIALEDELRQLKLSKGLDDKRPKMYKLIDKIFEFQKKHSVNRKKYIRLALICGWFTGSHHFYAKHYLSALFYLLLFWSGIPLAMTLVDLMTALPMKADADGNIEI